MIIESLSNDQLERLVKWASPEFRIKAQRELDRRAAEKSADAETPANDERPAKICAEGRW